jgi:hypothetical protein
MELQALVAKLFITINVLAGFPVPDTQPDVRFLPQAELARLSCRSRCRLVGAFSPEHGVLLSDQLDPIHEPRARSVLLHELVHHLQELYGRFDDRPLCERYFLREREAYAVQNRYLRRYNEPPDQGLMMLQWGYARCALDRSSPRS